MSFAAGAFLFALLALALPWWLHRRDSHGERRRRVSSTMLLRAAAEPVRARRRVRHVVLLAVRLGLLTALILAFAEPMLRGAAAPAAASPALPQMVVLDVSLSMQARFEEAREQARAVIAGLPPGAPVMLVLAGADLVSAVPPGNDRRALADALAAARPGWSRLDFAGLLARLGVLAGAGGAGPFEVHLVSDLQHSGMPGNFNALVTDTAGRIAALSLYPVTGPEANWRLSAVRRQDEVVATVAGFATAERTLSVRLLVADDAGRRLRAATEQAGATTVRVPANGRASVALPMPAPGTGDLALRVELDGADALPGDDRAHLVWRRAQTLTVPLSSRADGRQRRFLEAALKAAAPGMALAPADAPGPAAVVLDAALDAGEVGRLQRHLDQGGHVFMTAGPALRRAGRVPLLDIDLDLDGTVARGGREIRVINPVHPVASNAASWRDVTIARAVRLSRAPGGDVILALDDGTPLLVEFSAGAGRVLLLTSALDRDWGTLVASAGFVTLVADLFRYLTEDVLPERAIAGAPLAVAAGNVQLFDASGARLLSLGDTVGRPGVRIDEPGIYTFRTPNRETRLAVDVDPRESILAPAPAALLARWQDAVRRPETAAEAGLADRAPAGTLLPLAPWLLALAALLFLIEAALANLARPGAGS